METVLTSQQPAPPINGNIIVNWSKAVRVITLKLEGMDLPSLPIFHTRVTEYLDANWCLRDPKTKKVER